MLCACVLAHHVAQQTNTYTQCVALSKTRKYGLVSVKNEQQMMIYLCLMMTTEIHHFLTIWDFSCFSFPFSSSSFLCWPPKLLFEPTLLVIRWQWGDTHLHYRSLFFPKCNLPSVNVFGLFFSTLNSNYWMDLYYFVENSANKVHTQNILCVKIGKKIVPCSGKKGC